MRKRVIAFGISMLIVMAALPVEAAELQALLKTLSRIEGAGNNNPAATEAWNELAKTSPENLPEILAAFDDCTVLGANWLNLAVDTIADRAVDAGEKLPAQGLEGFVLDRQRNPRARRLAYDLLVRVDPAAQGRLVPTMLNDPGVEFRRDAVAHLLNQAEGLFAGKDPAQTRLLQQVIYQQTLAAARDDDQIKVIVKKLKKLGVPVDLPRHFGFLMNWKVVGPFNNKDRKGFAVAYPPEKKLDLAAQYDGQEGPVKWQAYQTADDYGMVNINEPYGMLKEVLAYAVTDFDSSVDRQVELRLGCKNAWKVWLNGELLFQRDEYHRGMRLDQYRLKANLKKGRNVIMLKLCQNEQMENWTKEWQFQLRVCDATGTAILSPSRPASGGNGK
jgi:hypothetical protein